MKVSSWMWSWKIYFAKNFGLHYWFTILHAPVPSCPWTPINLVNRLKKGGYPGVFSYPKARIMLGASYSGMDGWKDGWMEWHQSFWQSRFSKFLKALVQVLDYFAKRGKPAPNILRTRFLFPCKKKAYHSSFLNPLTALQGGWWVTFLSLKKHI